MYYTYVLYSTKFDRIYIGFSANPKKRLESHNLGFVKSTKHYIPWEIAYIEEYYSRAEAMKREKQLKSAKGRAFIRKILNEK